MESSAEGMRALRISLAALGGTAVAQAVVVAFTGSVALLGDTVHNFADALTALPLSVAFVLGRRRPTRRYTYGYGRAEDLAGIVVVLMIALSAAVAAYEATRRLFDPREVDYLVAVATAGVVGFVGNELVARYRIRVGRRIGSAALVADGLHARTDGFTSLAVVVGAIGVAAGLEWADPVVGLMITAAILIVLRSATREVLHRLMDAVDPALVDEIEHVLRHVDGVEGVGAVRVRWIGHTLHAEADIVVDMDLRVSDGHAIAASAEHALIDTIPRLGSATIHADPCGHDGVDPHDQLRHHAASRG
jgi:cation diffusion facilitator family transporter